jgi:aspartyl-tRNA(Asn)/glutamyl-tRNA(Gln) amidotransferase subunit A
VFQPYLFNKKAMHHLSACQLHKKFINKELSAHQIVSYFLERIEKYDGQIGAFLAVFKEKALKEAKELDAKRDRGEKLGKMAGIPIAIKDNIHIEGEITTCASKFLTNYRAPFHATVVQRLIDEDAIIIGKTNLDEFAMGSSTENSALQVTKNPWDLNCVPGGSSGGSAAAVGARLVPIALGSDTGGSVRQPGSLCGVVGYKPTYGLVSRFGLVAYGSSLDQIGPLSTNVEDTMLTMEVISGHCDKDSTSLPGRIENFSPPVAEPLTVGVPWRFLEKLEEEPKELFSEGIERLKKRGAKVIDVDLSILEHSLATYYIIATAEASTNLARFDGVRYGVRSEKAKTLQEVYDLSRTEGFGKEVKRRILLGTFVLSSGYQDAYYRKAQKVRTLMINKFKEAFEQCDLVATPVSPFDAFPLGSIKDPIQMYLEDLYTIGCNLAGLPAVSVPSTFTKANKPMGLQLIGPQLGDAKLLSCAKLYENETTTLQKVPAWLS